MSSTILLPPRAQLCIRYCSNKHTRQLVQVHALRVVRHVGHDLVEDGVRATRVRTEGTGGPSARHLRHTLVGHRRVIHTWLVSNKGEAHGNFHTEHTTRANICYGESSCLLKNLSLKLSSKRWPNSHDWPSTSSTSPAPQQTQQAKLIIPIKPSPHATQSAVTWGEASSRPSRPHTTTSGRYRRAPRLLSTKYILNMPQPRSRLFLRHRAWCAGAGAAGMQRPRRVYKFYNKWGNPHSINGGPYRDYPI
jgi:hypothetical protein